MSAGAPLVRRLLEVVDAMAANLDTTSLLEQLSHSAQELFGAVGACWCRLEGQELTIVTAAGLSSDLVGLTFPLEGSAVGSLLARRRRSLCDRAVHFPHLNDRIYTGPDDQVAVALALPGGQTTGALYVTLQADHVFGPDELAVLELLASHAGMALHHVELYAEAERGRKSQEIFLATASHELRTPITVLRGFGDTLLRHWDVLSDERRLELIERMLSRTESMAELVERILEASSAGVPSGGADAEPFDLAEVARVATRNLSGASPPHPVLIHAPAPVTAIGRPGTVPGVLDQLVENAVKYSPRGSEIEVSVRAEPSAAVLTVADRGRGIPPDELDRVFERFYRAGGGVPGTSGVGLGLWIVRQTVEAQGGAVLAERRPGGGTLVHVRLPAPATRPSA